MLRVDHAALLATRRRRPRRKKVNPAKLHRTRLAVFERDGYACQHCGLYFTPPAGYDGSFALAQTLDVRLKNGRRRSVYLALDHVQPYSLGGPFEVGNLQALCSTCNGRKGARIDAGSAR